MSKIGKQPIEIPENITITLDDNEVVVSNGKDKMSVKRLSGVNLEQNDKELILTLEGKDKQSQSNWGTLRSLIQNTITGLTTGFEKTLMITGVGYRINKEGEDLDLSLGFSHPVKYKKPEGITFEVEGKNKVTIKGQDKALVGQVAAEIRALRPVEPYKGKGFRYKDEVVRRKVGKKATGEGVGGE